MAQPAVGLASGYLHRSGDLGRSHPRRWTHTARAASAGAAGKKSTPGHWNTWNTEACRLLQAGLGEKKKESSNQLKDTTAESFPAQLNSEALGSEGIKKQTTNNNKISQPLVMFHAKHCTKCFTYTNAFHLYDNHMGQILLTPSILIIG